MYGKFYTSTEKQGWIKGGGADSAAARGPQYLGPLQKERGLIFIFHLIKGELQPKISGLHMKVSTSIKAKRNFF